MRRMSARTLLGRPLALLSLLAAAAAPAPAVAEGGGPWIDWLEGVSWLVDAERRREVAALPPADREAAVAAILDADPLPATAVNELRQAVAARRRLMFSEVLSVGDDRARLLFLHGRPASRRVVDCPGVFRPLEVWTYGGHQLLLYRQPAAGYRLWLPFDSKRALYTDEVEFWLEEWEAVGRRYPGRRADRALCADAAFVDRVTGIDGLSQELPEPPDSRALFRYLDPPSDLAAWATQVAVEEAVPGRPLAAELAAIDFPARRGQRVLTRWLLALPPGSGAAPLPASDGVSLHLAVDGVVEVEGALLDSFRVRYELPAEPRAGAAGLAGERALRPGQQYLLRLRVRDEVGGGWAVVSRLVEVPREPDAAPSSLAGSAPTERLDRQLQAGSDALVLLLPPRDVVFGNVRAQALVIGERIERVTFLVDGQPQLTRNRAPFTVELSLPLLPREMVVRVEGYDAAGGLVAADEEPINQLRGELAVEILEPRRGQAVRGAFEARWQVVVPEERRVERVELFVDEAPVAVLEEPPWVAALELPPGDGLSYLTVAATLDDGSRAEDVRFLRVPFTMDEVDVRLVELYTTVFDRRGEMIDDLAAGDFEVLEDGRRQQLAKFELVEGLPLTVGITLDVSGSMMRSLGEARQAATGFLHGIVTPRDQCFAVAFADEPRLVMHRSSDPAAAAAALATLAADGWTSLHDAVVFSLYYFQGVRGRRALVLLSDGDDTDSRIDFPVALEYARQSGVAIYAIGLQNDALDVAARRKLGQLARETGGRLFLIARASELSGVYRQIEAELRSQYLLAYASDRPTGEGYRQVEVRVKRRGAQVRTIPGYYP
ncbi:MAG TPA: VWA domain-containing protein [Thermoanaerobaculia bacterium]|nr:VWA domain-containing protein [Thermoanaerobaculia bacterium]